MADQLALAHAIAARMAAHYAADLLCGGVGGAVAQERATEFSGLSLLFIIKGKASLSERAALVQGVSVRYSVIGAAEIGELLDDGGLQWPIWQGRLEGLRPLAGPPEELARWVARGRAVRPARLRVKLAQHLAELGFASYGHLRSAGVRRDSAAARWAAQQFLSELALALAMLNAAPLPSSGYRALVASFSFAKLPVRWQEQVEHLLVSNTLEAIVTTAGSIMAAYWQLLVSEDLNLSNYQLVEQLPLA